MSNVVGLMPRPASLSACTISRDLGRFDQLVTEMEAELGDKWGDIALADAARFLSGPAAAGLRFVVLALDADDEGDPAIAQTIAAARAAGLRVMLIVDGIGPASLQQILRSAPDDVLAYPLPHGALREAARRGRTDDPLLDPADDLPESARRAARRGVVIPVIGVAGGVGATTLAIGIAWELGARNKVCLIDLDPQSGAVAACLNLGNTTPSAFPQGLQNWRGRFQVLIAATRGADDLARLIANARAEFDIVLIDMPTGDAELAGAAMDHADIGLSVMMPDARSMRSAMRLARDLDETARQKLRHIVNRAPGVIDISGRARMRRIAGSINVAARLPDGGDAVADSADRALPLAEVAPRNGFRRSLLALAESLPFKR